MEEVMTIMVYVYTSKQVPKSFKYNLKDQILINIIIINIPNEAFTVHSHKVCQKGIPLFKNEFGRLSVGCIDRLGLNEVAV